MLPGSSVCSFLFAGDVLSFSNSCWLLSQSLVIQHRLQLLSSGTVYPPWVLVSRTPTPHQFSHSLLIAVQWETHILHSCWSACPPTQPTTSRASHTRSLHWDFPLCGSQSQETYVKFLGGAVETLLSRLEKSFRALSLQHTHTHTHPHAHTHTHAHTHCWHTWRVLTLRQQFSPKIFSLKIPLSQLSKLDIFIF